MTGNGNAKRTEVSVQTSPGAVLHPAWRDFVRYCTDLRFGEIERLSIQDGLPVLAEVTTKKVKFGS
jgi:hypothetical protein